MLAEVKRGKGEQNDAKYAKDAAALGRRRACARG